MNVNKNRLKHLLALALQDNCFRCPLRTDKENCKHNVAKSYDEMIEPCESYLLNWLQKFDVAEALEQGAHIVNGVAVFPPEEIPSQPNYGTPCEEVNRRGKADWWCDAAYCDYADCCPYL